MGNQVPAIQPFSSPPSLPALIRQNNKVLPSKQMLVLCSPSVQGGHRELPRRSLLLLWYLSVTHRRHRDLEREDRVTAGTPPVRSLSTQLHHSASTSNSTSRGLNWAWEKEKPKSGATQQAEQQLQEELEHWTAPAEGVLDCVHQRRAAPAQAGASRAISHHVNGIIYVGTLEVSCQAMFLMKD